MLRVASLGMLLAVLALAGCRGRQSQACADSVATMRASFEPLADELALVERSH